MLEGKKVNTRRGPEEEKSNNNSVDQEINQIYTVGKQIKPRQDNKKSERKVQSNKKDGQQQSNLTLAVVSAVNSQYLPQFEPRLSGFCSLALRN